MWTQENRETKKQKSTHTRANVLLAQRDQAVVLLVDVHVLDETLRDKVLKGAQPILELLRTTWREQQGGEQLPNRSMEDSPPPEKKMRMNWDLHVACQHPRPLLVHDDQRAAEAPAVRGHGDGLLHIVDVHAAPRGRREEGWGGRRFPRSIAHARKRTTKRDE